MDMDSKEQRKPENSVKGLLHRQARKEKENRKDIVDMTTDYLLTSPC